MLVFAMVYEFFVKMIKWNEFDQIVLDMDVLVIFAAALVRCTHIIHNRHITT